MSSFAQNAAFVLVHGAWADGSCRQNVILPLRNNGLQVTCAPIPPTSLEEEVAPLGVFYRAGRHPAHTGSSGCRKAASATQSLTKLHWTRQRFMAGRDVILEAAWETLTT
ncbi:MAG TPA: hypothetical protein VGM43_27705 [Bryobacteraceae bacterium]|jgi:hypothetical protein